MELRVNDYVRTKDGHIEKIIDKYKATYDYKIVVNEDFKFKHYEHNYIKHIIKSSPSIIDLIEENDLIEIEYKISTGENQKEIVQVIKNVNNKLFIKTYTEHYVFIEDIEKTIYKIKGIITHEQIESMEYKVKE